MQAHTHALIRIGVRAVALEAAPFACRTALVFRWDCAGRQGVLHALEVLNPFVLHANPVEATAHASAAI